MYYKIYFYGLERTAFRRTDCGTGMDQVKFVKDKSALGGRYPFKFF